MASLSGLKLAMGTSIFIASFIFGLFLLGIIFVLQVYVFGFDIWIGALLALGGIALFILFQYLLGPAIVASTARLHYIKEGETWNRNMLNLGNKQAGSTRKSKIKHVAKIR